MITLFTIPKPFEGHIGIIQENAIQSWKALGPEVQIVLYGDEEGCAAAAAKYGVKHIPNVQCNEFGTPLLDFVFAHAKSIRNTEFLFYTNADIIFMTDVYSLLEMVCTQMLKPFLIAGRRIDLDVKEPIDTDDTHWKNKLLAVAETVGTLHGYSGMDYFIFPTNLPVTLKGFAVGRPGWDNWFINAARQQSIPVIDATTGILAIHQNHPPAYNLKMKESQNQIELLGGLRNMGNLRNADKILTPLGVRRLPFKRVVIKYIVNNPVFHALLTAKRKLSYIKNSR